MSCKCGSNTSKLGKSGPRKCMNPACGRTEYKGVWYTPEEWGTWVESVLGPSGNISTALDEGWAEMTLVERGVTHDFYIEAGKGDTPTLYNIVPAGSPAPEGGYRNRQYIERIKGVKFPDRYQPTQHGMTELYLTDGGKG